MSETTEELLADILRRFLDGIAIGIEREAGHREFTGVEVAHLLRESSKKVSAEALKALMR